MLTRILIRGSRINEIRVNGYAEHIRTGLKGLGHAILGNF